MKQCKFVLRWWVLSVALIVAGCGIMEEPKPKNAPFGLITTPASYYSTAKARSLGDKYKANLDRLVERIVRDPKTASLQFANNIASVGGIGFFTHSAATTPDERYLEIVLAAPETFETSGDPSGKLNQLFTSYGLELLSILVSDSEIYQEKDIAGYGLNLSWRNVVRESNGPRVTLERAVAYFPKQKVRGFLRQELSQNDLLHGAVIFAVEEDGPMKLVSFTPVESKPDFRPPIQEQTLADTPLGAKAEGKSTGAGSPTSSTAQSVQTGKKAAEAKIEQPSIKETFAKGSDLRRNEDQEVVGTASSAREEKIASSNPGGDETTIEGRNTDTVPEKNPPKQSHVNNALKEVQESSAQDPSPTIGVSPARPAASKPNEAVSFADFPRDKLVSGPITAKTELPDDRSDRDTARTVAPLKENETTGKERAASDQPLMESERTTTAPAKKLEAANEREVRSSPAPIEDIQPANAETTNMGNEPPSTPKVPQLNDTNLSGPTPILTKEENSRSTEAATAFADKAAEGVVVAPKPETKGAALTQSFTGKANPSKQNVTDTPSANPSDNKNEQLNPIVEQPKVVDEKPIGSRQPQAATVAQPAPDELSSAIGGTERKGDAANVAKGAAEIGPVPAPIDPGEHQKTESSLTALKPEPQPVVVSKAVVPQIEVAATESPSRTQSPTVEITNLEAVKKSDALESMQIEKREVALPAPEVSLETPKVTIQNEVAVQEEKEPAPKLAHPMEQPTNTVLPAQPEIKSPATPEPASVAQPQVPDKANEAIALLKEKPFETSTAQPPPPLEKAEIQKPEVPSMPVTHVPGQQAEVSEKPANEQIALLTKKPAEVIPEKKAIPRPAPKALEGYIIQLSFSEQPEARRWAESFMAQGYAVSMTEVGSSAFRVRIGNFAVRSDAEKRLKTFSQEGLKGIVLNLPQAYRPDTNRSAEATADVISVSP